jgi:adenylosuccinate lyase
MNVQKDVNLHLKEELIKSTEVTKYLTKEDILNIFSNNNLLKNVDYIFSRTIDETK